MPKHALDSEIYKSTPQAIMNIARYNAFFKAMEADGWKLGPPNLIGRSWWRHRSGREIEHRDAKTYYYEHGACPPPF